MRSFRSDLTVQSLLALVCVCDSGIVVVIAGPTILCLATLENVIISIGGSHVEEFHHVGLSVHVEDEDDEKYCFQLELNHSKCCWTARSNVSRCLEDKCNGTGGTPLP